MAYIVILGLITEKFSIYVMLSGPERCTSCTPSRRPRRRVY